MVLIWIEFDKLKAINEFRPTFIDNPLVNFSQKSLMTLDTSKSIQTKNNAL